MRSRRRTASCVCLCLGACGSGPCSGTRGAGLAALALVALGGRHLGGHMSQWHHARGRWGQDRGFSGRSSSKRKGGRHIPERVLKRILLQKNVFPPWIFFNKLQEQNEELGLIIDLTYTRRYYKPEDLPETLRYLRICTIGHQVPDDDTIFKFQCAVNGFLKENKDNGNKEGRKSLLPLRQLQTFSQTLSRLAVVH
ncbi:RNA/RNP complex-1-interacting phosphatase-like isoform X3 [Physeter macrocephalus]|uniref:RNA/RNP complex-1-interacting phosphatase-like isoform X3 n=1 Tax=Physeter macrocephalus TaxID=9755 RepID=A0A9W2X1E6_PHYMC|nr:RNA/RNP complex-1-interacting phosphatase-like isoform X3 [Physeter catodon]